VFTAIAVAPVPCGGQAVKPYDSNLKPKSKNAERKNALMHVNWSHHETAEACVEEFFKCMTENAGIDRGMLVHAMFDMALRQMILADGAAAVYSGLRTYARAFDARVQADDSKVIN
jgi:hypothetical protein